MRAVQRMYKKETMDYYIMSPYTRIIFLDMFKVCFLRTDTKRSVTIAASGNGVLKMFVHYLQQGISPNILIEFLCKMGVEEPDTWIQLFIREGIIE